MTTPAESLALAAQYRAAGRFREAEGLCGSVLRADPTNAQALHLLGVIAAQTGDRKRAVQHFRQLLRFRPGIAVAHFNLGLVLQELERLDEAANSYRRALEIRADYTEATNNLGAVLRKQRKLADAEQCYRQVLRTHPNEPSAHRNLGVVLMEQGQHDAAIVCFERALAINPDFYGAHWQMARAFHSQGKFAQAIDASARAIAIAPEAPHAWNPVFQILAEGHPVADETLLQCGPENLQKAALSFLQRLMVSSLTDPFDRVLKRSLDLLPGDRDLEAMALYRSHFDYDANARLISRAYRDWCARHFPSSAPVARRTRKPGDPIRLAYVGDYLHAMFLSQMIRFHSPDDFQVFLYTNDDRYELSEENPELRVIRMQDVDIVESCRSNGIDIAIDLCGPIPWERSIEQFAAFRARLAPVQCSWVATINTSGSPASDYVLADPFVVPPQLEALYTERICRLPRVCHCWEPPRAGPVRALPALTRGHVTFGSANRGFKLTDEVLALWARVTARVADARFHFKGRHAADAAFQDRAAGIFASQGVAAQRLIFSDFTAHPEFLEFYGEIDISLDTYPYNGGITTLETLWMGVPVVTRAGEIFASRVSGSYLCCLSLDALACDSEDAFVEAAVSLAEDQARLNALRHGLRHRMLESPLCNGRLFVRQFEALCRELLEADVD